MYLGEGETALYGKEGCCSQKAHKKTLGGGGKYRKRTARKEEAGGGVRGRVRIWEVPPTGEGRPSLHEKNG